MTKDRLAFNVLGYLLVGIVSLFCIIPFLIVLSGSFTAEESILKHGYTLIPRIFSAEAYEIIFKAPSTILRAYAVTVFVTVTGTLVGLFISALAAYVLNSKDFRFRNQFAFYFYFTTIFSGGIVPWYIIMVKYLHLKDNLLALILPPMVNVIYMLILRSFFRAIPDAIRESAMIDGANDFTIFVRLILPLSKSSLATIGLFTALNYWNDWFNTMLFIDNDKLLNLQYYLYQIISKMDFMNAAVSNAGIPIPLMPSESIKLAMTVVAVGPIIFLYPFIQRYFVKGLTIGAVKG